MSGWSAATRDYLQKTDTWFASPEAASIAQNILSYQSAYGGWPKNMDLTKAPFAGQKRELVGDLRPIFDNGATVDEIRFLAHIYRVTKDERYLRAVRDGIDYILVAQYPTGGWPQFYPPDSQYHRHITFNDNSMVRILKLLKEVGSKDGYAFLDQDRKLAAQSAFQRGIDCILRCQIKIGDKLTAWCAQHDELSYAARPGRSFELVSLSGAESVEIVRLLTSLPDPSPEVVQSIEAAVAWLQSAKIEGWRVEKQPEIGQGKNYIATPDAGAATFWARFYDLTTGQPLWADRDGVPHLGMENVGWARQGYQWTGVWPKILLEQTYPIWKANLAQAKLKLGPARAEWTPKLRISLAGDSTVKDEGGWGFGFKKLLNADVLCRNFAIGGQSSKSFRTLGAWDRTLESKPDCVLIQFGHNDMPGKGPNRETDPETTYAENLTRFVQEARAAGAKPVLVTSLVRRIFEPDGQLRGELAPYAKAAKRVAKEQGVPLVDLFELSRAAVQKLGQSAMAEFNPIVIPKPPAPGAQPEPSLTKDLDSTLPADAPRDDVTHLTAYSSAYFGRMVVDELVRVVPELAPYFRLPETR